MTYVVVGLSRVSRGVMVRGLVTVGSDNGNQSDEDDELKRFAENIALFRPNKF